MIRLAPEALERYCVQLLEGCQVRPDVAGHVAAGLVQASLRGVDSHGVRLLPHYLAALKAGRLNPTPAYRFERTAPATGLLDGDHTFGHAAGMEAARHAIALAQDAGLGAVAVFNSSHFGAAAFFALEIARHDMIGLSFTNSDALVKSYGGQRPFFGNNPICMAAPCEGEEPFCLDMATSVVTFNKVRQWRAEHAKAPAGVGADRAGAETTNPDDITMLLPIGGYKGYGLSMAVEILCSTLTGMPFGPHIPRMFDAPLHEKRRLAHFILALRIANFQDPAAFKQRLAGMMRELRSEPTLDGTGSVRVPGDPEKADADARRRDGIPLGPAEFEVLHRLAAEYGVRAELAKETARTPQAATS